MAKFVNSILHLQHGDSLNYPAPKSSHFSALVSNSLKFFLAVALIIWLVRSGSIRLAYLYVPPAGIPIFIAGAAALLLGMTLSALRYKLLIRGAGLSLSLYKSLRISAVMYFFTQCVFGPASGDVARYFHTTRETGHGTKVGAAIMVDRFIGTMGLFILSGLGLILNWSLVESSPTLRLVAIPLLAVLCGLWLSFFLGLLSLIKNRKTALLTGLVFPAFIVLLFVAETSKFIGSEVVPVLFFTSLAAIIVPALAPELLENGYIYKKILCRTKLGSKIGEFISATLLYQNSLNILAQTILVTAIQHLLFIMALFFFSQAQNLPILPDFGTIFFAAPLSFLAGIIPAPAAGLGVNEAAFETLVMTVSGGNISAGASIYLMYRIWTTLFSLSGLPFLLKFNTKTVDSS